MPDRVAGIPADGEGIDGEYDLFMSVIGRTRGTKGFSFALIPKDHGGGFSSYDFDTTHIEHSLSHESRWGIVFLKIILH